MSRIVFNHESVDRFAVGAVGVPGERSFFLQISSPSHSNCVAIEKTQVAAISEKFKEMIQELRRSKLASLDELSVAGQKDSYEMEYPITEDFQVGAIGISWNRDLQRVEIEIQAVYEQAVEDLISENSIIDDQELPDLITASLRIYQIRSFCTQSDLLVSAGRAPCPFCGLPIDLEGHLCPRSNGYRR